jgi:hypothetical protein
MFQVKHLAWEVLLCLPKTYQSFRFCLECHPQIPNYLQVLSPLRTTLVEVTCIPYFCIKWNMPYLQPPLQTTSLKAERPMPRFGTERLALETWIEHFVELNKLNVKLL